MKTVRAKLDLNTIKLLEEKAKKEGKNKNQILKELIVNYISNNAEDQSATNQQSKSEPINVKQETQAKTIVVRSGREGEKEKAEIRETKEKLVPETIQKEPNEAEENNEVESREQNIDVSSEVKKKSFWMSFFEDDSYIFDEDEKQKVDSEKKKDKGFWESIFGEDEVEDEENEDEIELLLFGLLAIVLTGGIGGIGVKSLGVW